MWLISKKGLTSLAVTCNSTRNLYFLHYSIFSIWQKICISMRHFKKTRSTPRPFCGPQIFTRVTKYFVAGHQFDISGIAYTCRLCRHQSQGPICNVGVENTVSVQPGALPSFNGKYFFDRTIYGYTVQSNVFKWE